MPMTDTSQERDERRITMLLYIGTMVVLLILLYATYSNIRTYKRSVETVRKHNALLLELDGILRSLQDQETGARGFLLTNDSAYLEPYRVAGKRYTGHFTKIDSLIMGTPLVASLDSLRFKGFRVRSDLSVLLMHVDPLLTLPPAEAYRLREAKTWMDGVRSTQQRIRETIEAERRELEQKEIRSVDSSAMIILYALLAIAATAVLFWRLSRALLKNEKNREALQQKVRDLDNEVHLRTRVQGMLQKVLDISPNGIMSFKAIRDPEGKIIDFEFLSSNRAANAMVKRNDLVGKRLLVEMPENADAGLFSAYCSVVETGKPFKKEFHYQADGINSWFANEAVASEDGFVVTFMDVTEQRLAHEAAAESDRLALTGQITRTVAHEVRNPLTNIHLAVEQLHDEVDAKAPDVAPFFEIIDRNLKRIGTLIREMLESAKKRELNLVPCSMEDIVNNALKRVADRLELRGMRAIVELDTDLPLVMADCELIDLAITNLAVNAVEAMEPGKGELRFTVRRVGEEVLLEVTDNGKGIPPDELNRLFEPFYSGRTGGLGLGLTTARSILHSHQVKLEPRSTLGEGTTFALRFPSRTFAA